MEGVVVHVDDVGLRNMEEFWGKLVGKNFTENSFSRTDTLQVKWRVEVLTFGVKSTQRVFLTWFEHGHSLVVRVFQKVCSAGAIRTEFRRVGNEPHGGFDQEIYIFLGNVPV
jgi:hypothetical protein